MTKKQYEHENRLFDTIYIYNILIEDEFGIIYLFILGFQDFICHKFKSQRQV